MHSVIKAPRTNKLERKEREGKEEGGEGRGGTGQMGREGKGRKGKESNRNYTERGNLGVPSRPSIHAGLPLICR